jgi:hypothetical protein
MSRDPASERAVLARLAALTAASPNASGLGGFISEITVGTTPLGRFSAELLETRLAGEEETAGLLAMAFELWASAHLSGAILNVD